MLYRVLARGVLMAVGIVACGCGRLAYDAVSHDAGSGMDAPALSPMDASTDAGAEPVDSGPEPLDSGTEPLDSGTEPLDSGTEPADSGPEPADSGPEPVDSGPEPLDSGPEPLDSGPEPVDSGMTMGCGVGELECGALCLAGAVCCPGDIDPVGCGCATPRACAADGTWQACATTCTPGATESCSGCMGGGTRTCSSTCTWGACTNGAGQPCGSCTNGAFYCSLPTGSGWTCTGGRWSCTCACSGGGPCC